MNNFPIAEGEDYLVLTNVTNVQNPFKATDSPVLIADMLNGAEKAV